MMTMTPVLIGQLACARVLAHLLLTQQICHLDPDEGSEARKLGPMQSSKLCSNRSIRLAAACLPHSAELSQSRGERKTHTGEVSAGSTGGIWEKTRKKGVILAGAEMLEVELSPSGFRTKVTMMQRG